MNSPDLSTYIVSDNQFDNVLSSPSSIHAVCASGPAGSTLVLRHNEKAQAARPGVPERSNQTGALPVQQGKWTPTHHTVEATVQQATEKSMYICVDIQCKPGIFILEKNGAGNQANMTC